MKAYVERYGCIGCGLCSDTCPAVFRMDEEGLAEVYQTPVPQGEEKNVRQAADNCPVSVIMIE